MTHPTEFLGRVAREAAALDGSVKLPSWLRDGVVEAGWLLAPFPAEFGGGDLATTRQAASVDLLWSAGRAWLPLGRLIEGHINAVRLAWCYGASAQLARMAIDAQAGHWSAIWTADLPGAPLRLMDGVLHGQKAFAAGAEIVTRPVVTTHDRDGLERLAWVRLPVSGAQIVARVDLLGMRGAGMARIDLTGATASASDLIGAPGDYLREPELSVGAWRLLAVLAGGLAALADAFVDDLRARGWADDPHQRTRLGRVMIAREQALLWAREAGRRADGDPASLTEAADWIKLARNAVDAACAEAVALVQRGAGFAAAARPHPIERLCRDLTTLMRQPALDEALDSAAATALRGEA